MITEEQRLLLQCSASSPMLSPELRTAIGAILVEHGNLSRLYLEAEDRYRGAASHLLKFQINPQKYKADGTPLWEYLETSPVPGKKAAS